MGEERLARSYWLRRAVQVAQSEQLPIGLHRDRTPVIDTPNKQAQTRPARERKKERKETNLYRKSQSVEINKRELLSLM